MCIFDDEWTDHGQIWTNPSGTRHISSLDVVAKCLKWRVDHKAIATTFRRPDKPAFGEPNQPVGVVERLARCTASRGALRLAERTDLDHQMAQYYRPML